MSCIRCRSAIQGNKVSEMKVPETVEGLAEIGRWLDESRSRALSCGRPLRSRRDGSWIFCSITGWRCIRSIPRRWIGSGIAIG